MTFFNSKKWNERFLNLAEHVSLWSKDPSTEVTEYNIPDEKGDIWENLLI